MIKNILISGATGFIGSNLIDFCRNDYKFINVGRSKSELCDNVYWDLNSELNFSSDNNIDLVVHSASIVGSNNLLKSDYIDINVKSTLELLEYCVRNDIKKFIYISTGGVYGYNEQESDESTVCNPIDIYSMSKYFSEQLCNLYKDKISIVILRIFFPYGNGQSGRLFNNLCENIICKNEFTLNNGGTQLINPIHIIDIVNIMKKIIEIDCSGVFNISGSEYISLENLCKRIAFHANIERLNLNYRDNNNISNLIGSNKKIFKLLNYNTKVDLDIGINMYLDSIYY